jgi:hypothetical protein
LEDGEIIKKTYSQLSGKQQYLVNQNLNKLPSWAKNPSKTESKKLIEYKNNLIKSEKRKEINMNKNRIENNLSKFGLGSRMNYRFEIMDWGT